MTTKNTNKKGLDIIGSSEDIFEIMKLQLMHHVHEQESCAQEAKQQSKVEAEEHQF